MTNEDEFIRRSSYDDAAVESLNVGEDDSDWDEDSVSGLARTMKCRHSRRLPVDEQVEESTTNDVNELLRIRLLQRLIHCCCCCTNILNITPLLLVALPVFFPTVGPTNSDSHIRRNEGLDGVTNLYLERWNLHER
jgi:hypothetical protein